ncbi:MAG: thymidine phosphorylase [Spirochaetales bacterium]|nr:thymidine phosphorylase [Spirochaetales bacterium]
MRALDIVIKKRRGEALSREEISFLIRDYVGGSIPEYQMSAFLMAVFFQGMTSEETGYLTREMIDSGETIDLSALRGPFVDKHSTGGVGDKVSLILAPLAAACGLQVPMMSGRSLGHTGGTLDKLESIPGYRTDLDSSRFATVIGECGFAMTGQSENVVPADRLLYALRDATGTVENIPLITSSILSKKFAEGADALVFDVKTGPGAFMKTTEDARALARSLVDTGRSLGKRIVAVLTRMETPLGSKVGNFLEVEESLALLRCPAALERVPTDGRSDDLMEVTLRLTAWMLVTAGKAASVEEGSDRCRRALEDGSAWRRMEHNIRLQGGDLDAMYDALGTLRAAEHGVVKAPSSGVLTRMDAFQVGMGGVYLGAGRSRADDDVHGDVGFEILKKPGETVQSGESLLAVWGHTARAVDQAIATVETGIEVDPDGAPGPARDAMILEELSTL